MKIVFLLDNAYGIGGTIRSTVNLSSALAERHRVEVVSLRRSAREPRLDPVNDPPHESSHQARTAMYAPTTYSTVT